MSTRQLQNASRRARREDLEDVDGIRAAKSAAGKLTTAELDDEADGVEPGKRTRVDAEQGTMSPQASLEYALWVTQRIDRQLDPGGELEGGGALASAFEFLDETRDGQRLPDERRRRLAEELATDLAQRTAAHDGAARSPARRGVARARGEREDVHAVQLRGTASTGGDVRRIAATGLAGTARALPHLEPIQRAFGRHDVRTVRAHVGGTAAEASRAIGARAYAAGDEIAFAADPDLHLAAHEAAHVVQQRRGVQLSSGVGRDGDEYERHADAVADRVVRGESAERLLDAFGADGEAARSETVQLDPDPAIRRSEYTYAPPESAGSGVTILDMRLRGAIPIERRTGVRLHLVEVLPAAALILDASLTPEMTAELHNPGSPHNYRYYSGRAWPAGFKTALEELYKARWEASDRGARQRHVTRGRSALGRLLQDSQVNSAVRGNGDDWRTDAQRIIESRNQCVNARIDAIRADATVTFVSYEGGAIPEGGVPARSSARGAWTAEQTGDNLGDAMTPEALAQQVDAEMIAASRAELAVTTTSREVEAVNPHVMAPMAVTHDPRDDRHRIFGPLLGLLNQQIVLEEQIEALRPPEGGAPHPDLARREAELTTLQANIATTRAPAAAAAQTFYQARLAEVADETPAAPTPRGQREGARIERDSLSTDRHSPATVRWFIDRALAALPENVTVHVTQTHHRVGVGGRTVELHPPRLTTAVDVPTGHRGGTGTGYQDGLVEEVVNADSGLGDYQQTAIHIGRAFTQLEGTPGSINTWDSAGVTAGSGIAARGNLQARLLELHEQDPAHFRALFGRFGIDAYPGGIAVTLPAGATFRENPPGTRLVGEDAIQYIMTDPVLLAQISRAGNAASWQRVLVRAMLVSVHSALAWSTGSVTRPATPRAPAITVAAHRWEDFVRDLPMAEREAAVFAMTNHFHATGNGNLARNALRDNAERIASEYHVDLATLALDGSTLPARREMARVVWLALAARRRSGFAAVVPAAAGLGVQQPPEGGTASAATITEAAEGDGE